MSLASSLSTMFSKKKKQNTTMASNNYFEPNKVTLTKWVDNALLQPLKK
jgi:hypothetical protein